MKYLAYGIVALLLVAGVSAYLYVLPIKCTYKELHYVDDARMDYIYGKRVFDTTANAWVGCRNPSYPWDMVKWPVHVDIRTPPPCNTTGFVPSPGNPSPTCR